MGTKNVGFHRESIQTRSSRNQRFRVWEVSTRLPRVSSMLQEVEVLPTLVYFQFLGWKWLDVRVLVKCPLPRRTVLRLSKDMRLPHEERDLSLGEGCVRLGEGVSLGEGMYA